LIEHHSLSLKSSEKLKLMYRGLKLDSNCLIGQINLNNKDILRLCRIESSSEMGDLKINSGECHDQGQRNSMEDAHLLCKKLKLTEVSCLKFTDEFPVHFYAIFDGHGGSECSQWLSNNIQKLLEKYLNSEINAERALECAFEEADRQLMEEHPQINSGSTCISILIETLTKTIWCANVGDSRCILCTRERAKPLSIDHKPTRLDESQRIKSAGGWVSHGRVMGFLGVSRSFGDSEMKSESCKIIISTPEVIKHKINPDDQFVLLACDGLFDVMDNEEILRVGILNFEIGRTCVEVSQRLVNAAIKEHGSNDNVSVIIVKLR